MQIPTATSQQMDDLFDILIESGGEFVILLQNTIDHVHLATQNINPNTDDYFHTW